MDINTMSHFLSLSLFLSLSPSLSVSHSFTTFTVKSFTQIGSENVRELYFASHPVKSIRQSAKGRFTLFIGPKQHDNIIIFLCVLSKSFQHLCLHLLVSSRTSVQYVDLFLFFFFYFRLFYKQLTVNKCSIKVADDWIRTRVLWYWGDRSVNCATTTALRT